MTGWGVDELWSVRAIEKGEKLGIFDQVRIGHYRPVKSSSWYGDLEIDPHQESRELKLRHGLVDRIPQRFHPLVEPPAPNNKVGLPPNAPFILGGQSGSCLRAVAEILLHSKRMYLDLDKSSDYPEVLDSKCMRNTSRHQGMTPGLAEPELIMRVLECAGSTDYGFSTLPTELQKELLLAGAHMRELLELGAKDPSCFNPSTRAFGGTWQRREQWGWKESRSMYYLPLWKALFGRFRFIHIVRDPRSISDDQMEAAAEFFDAMFAQNSAHLQIHPSADSANRERFELCWAKANLGVYQWASREMPHDYLLLRAEDLAGQDEKAKRETSRLLNFVGLDFVDRSRSDTVFRPIGPVRQVQAEPQQALVAEALRTFNYTRGVV
jgi:hypothetical protein